MAGTNTDKTTFLPLSRQEIFSHCRAKSHFDQKHQPERDFEKWMPGSLLWLFWLQAGFFGLVSPFLMKKCVLTGLLALLVCGGATHASKPKPSGSVQTTIENVRTTAYSYGPAHNGKYGNKNAIGGRLKAGSVRSAAADWSKWPVGTRFRVRETGQEYIVDDIGSAMVGTGTIDLFKPDNSQVRRWGVKRVTIEVIEWGSSERSLRILSDRTRHRHVRKMVESLRSQAAPDQT